jgi:hypothetical protein
MSAGQPAKPPKGRAFGFPPVVGLSPDPTPFSLRAPAVPSARHPSPVAFGGSPSSAGRDSRPSKRALTQKGWGRALAPAATPHPAPERGEPRAGSAPTTGGTPGSPGSLGPLPAGDALRSRLPREPGPGATPDTSPSGGRPAPVSPRVRKPLRPTRWGNATAPAPHRTGTGAHGGGSPGLPPPTNGTALPGAPAGNAPPAPRGRQHPVLHGTFPDPDPNPDPFRFQKQQHPNPLPNPDPLSGEPPRSRPANDQRA